MAEDAPKAAKTPPQQPYTGVKAAEVFATTELLETVLHLLPPEDILLTQIVCRTFHDTILSSLKVQRALFIKPRCLTRAERKTHLDFRNTGPHSINTLVCPDMEFDFYFGHWKLSASNMFSGRLQYERMPKTSWNSRMLPILRIPLRAERLEVAMNETGSWRRMYLCTLPYEVIMMSTIPHRVFHFRGSLGELIDTLDEGYEDFVAQSKFPETYAQAMAAREWNPTPCTDEDWEG